MPGRTEKPTMSMAHERVSLEPTRHAQLQAETLEQLRHIVAAAMDDLQWAIDQAELFETTIREAGFKPKSYTITRPTTDQHFTRVNVHGST